MEKPTKKSSPEAKHSPMSKEEKFQHWLNVAQYDLKSATFMHSNRQWLHVVFMCQQAIEKLVKGLFVLYFNDTPPLSHNIRALFGHFRKKLPSETPESYLDFFETLSNYYLNNRYPDYKKELTKQIKKAPATETLAKTKEVFAWLLTMKP